MSKYLYIASLWFAFAYIIIEQIRLFNKGKYNPYSFRNEERNVKELIINIVVIVVISISPRHVINPIFALLP